MASLSPATWLIAGAIITGVSLVFPSEKIKLFAVVGVGFLAVGAIKLYLARKDEPDKPTKDNYQTSSPRRAPNNDEQAQQCFVCGAKNSAQANFCGHCGHRL